MLKYKNIILFGPQGSGKGTQADILAEKFGMPHISTGEIFRQEIKEHTEIGKMAEQIINAGSLMPDDVTNEIVAKRLKKEATQEGFILEGYPRNINQAKALDSVIGIDLALEVWISDDEAVMRIGGRRTCPKCGAIYHLKFKPPRQDRVCDVDSEELVIRDDDKEEAVRKRLADYHEQTEPLIDFYKEKNIYKRINGMPPISEVTESIMEVVEG
ncbi:adenylate kinase [Patescibacteria group bacterium]|nr:adenylate kinase [Patescibacteria group bacterium]MBU4512654.1 adenylate kinase [Patescibacteria group bacterium]MCG2693560.1 adenylate kinase [Candidatus Parcubacteria bacterium]